MRKKAVIIASGGMDSTTLLYDILRRGYQACALSIDYGQRHHKELRFISRTCRKLKVPYKLVVLPASCKGLLRGSALTSREIKIPDGDYRRENMKLTVVPNRNMILLSLAVGYAISIGARKVFYGAHAGDHAIYLDCRKEFVEAMRRAVLLADWKRVELEAPYLRLGKADIARKGKALGVDYSLTWSCYKGGKKACGRCATCRERLEAFQQAGMRDPIEYED